MFLFLRICLSALELFQVFFALVEAFVVRFTEDIGDRPNHLGITVLASLMLLFVLWILHNRLVNGLACFFSSAILGIIHRGLLAAVGCFRGPPHNNRYSHV